MGVKGKKNTPTYRVGGHEPTWGQTHRRELAKEHQEVRSKMSYEDKVAHIEQKQKQGFNCTQERERLNRQYKMEDK